MLLQAIEWDALDLWPGWHVSWYRHVAL